jgi:predicted neuraminidase
VSVTLSVATTAAAPWRQCHASTIIEVAEGDLVLAFFAGTREGTDDNAIYLVRGVARHPGAADGTAGAATDSWSWSEPARLTDVMDAHWNPVLARSPLGKLTLFFKRGRPISQWQTLRMTSQDDGHSWSPAEDLVPGDRGGRGPVRNPPLVLSSGRWVAGASTEAGGSGGLTSTWDCFADVSDDDGLTWTRSENIPIDHSAIPGPGLIQPTVWTGHEGLVFLMRSSTGRAWRTVSTDEGATWSPAKETDLPNNNSGLCATRLPDGRVVCAHNTSEISWGPRNELALSVSTDDGRTATPRLTPDALPSPTSTITPDDAGVDTDGQSELSYPTLIAEPEALLVSYTRQRREIAVASVPLSSLG